MKDFFAYFGLAMMTLFCDVLSCVFAALITNADVSWVGFITNAIGFSIAIAFLTFGK